MPDWLTNINIDIWPSIHWPSPPSWLKKISGSAFSASGGIFTGAQSRIIGEAGPEAVVPLRRNLSMVDPAVRELSAIAQGLRPMASGGISTGGKVVNMGGVQVITPTEDPRAVAQEVFNVLVASGY